MKSKHIKVDNFKSLVDFDLPLAKFNYIVGLNGSGKSTFQPFKITIQTDGIICG